MFDIPDELLPAAIVAGDDGLELRAVAEVDGELVDRDSGEAIDLELLIVVVGLPELERAPAA